MRQTIYASFADTSDAEKAAGALLDHGVQAEDISLVQHREEGETMQEGSRAAGGMRDELGQPIADDYSSTADISSESNTGVNRVTAEFDRDDVNRGVTTDLESEHYTRGTSTGGMDESSPTSAGRPITHDPASDAEDDLSAKTGISTTTGADAGAGAAKGAAVGLGVGAIALLTSIFVPGFGLVAGGGALATAIGGMAASTGAGAIAGAVTGYLKDQGIDEDHARTYSEVVSSGGAVLAVTIPSGDCDREEVDAVLAKYGAGNVNSYQARMAA